MIKHKTKENLILNNSFPSFQLLILFATIYLGTVIDYWYFLLFLVVFISCLTIKPNWQQLLICLGICGIFIALVLTIPNFSLNRLIVLNLNKATNDIVRQSIFNFFEYSYGKEIASFIKLILFNVRSNETYYFIKYATYLGVIWLICISGFHISLLSKLISLCFKKIPKVGFYVNIVIVAFYSYLLNFSYSSIRVLITLSMKWCWQHFKIESYNKLGWVGIFICMLNPSCFNLNYPGFLMSFIGCAGVYFVLDLNLNNKLITSLLINIYCSILTIPFVVKMNHEISILTFINSFVFMYIFSFVFIYFLIFAWFPFMKIIHFGIMSFAYIMIGNVSFSNIYIYMKEWKPYINCVYYVACGIASVLSYKLVLKNKL